MTEKLSRAEINLILRALTIAAEDGSIYGGSLPGDAEEKAISSAIEEVERKLKTMMGNLQ